jgi:outer membrane protein
MLLTLAVDPEKPAAQSAGPVIRRGRTTATGQRIAVLLLLGAVGCEAMYATRAHAQATTEPAQGAPAASEPARRVLTLASALASARKQQPQLRSAAAATELAESELATARAPLLPQIVGTGLYQRTTANFVARPGLLPSATRAEQDPTFDLFNWWSFGATASQVVFDWGAQRRVALEKAEAKAARADQEARALDVDVQLRGAYFAAQAARAIVGVARAALANNQRHLEQIEAFVQVGTRPAIDLAQARVELANARVVLIQSENNYELARLRLNQAMGVEGDTAYDVDAGVLAERGEEALSSQQLLVRALSARTDLRAMEQRVSAREQGVRAARGGYGPSVTASTAVTDQGTELDDLTWNFNAGLALNWPLFDGLRANAQVQSARAQLAGAAADRDILRQAIRVQVEQARLDVVGAKAVLEASDEAQNAARERLALAEGRYEAGVGSIIELSDAQLALTQAEAQRVQAEFALSSARAALMRAVGSVD